MSVSPPSYQQAEGKGVEPSSLNENRVSSAAQQTVSGYLPYSSVESPSIELPAPAGETLAAMP